MSLLTDKVIVDVNVGRFVLSLSDNFFIGCKLSGNSPKPLVVVNYKEMLAIFLSRLCPLKILILVNNAI